MVFDRDSDRAIQINVKALRSRTAHHKLRIAATNVFGWIGFSTYWRPPCPVLLRRDPTSQRPRFGGLFVRLMTSQTASNNVALKTQKGKERMQKPFVTIENWAVIQGGWPNFEDLQPGTRLVGNVFGHMNLPDTNLIYTSPILRVNTDRGLVETLNSVYQLGAACDAYKTWEQERKQEAAAQTLSTECSPRRRVGSQNTRNGSTFS
jgi:hypothetical protein